MSKYKKYNVDIEFETREVDSITIEVSARDKKEAEKKAYLEFDKKNLGDVASYEFTATKLKESE